MSDDQTTTRPIFCGKCGKQPKPGAVFCGTCGAPVRLGAQPPMAPTTQVHPVIPANDSEDWAQPTEVVWATEATISLASTDKPAWEVPQPAPYGASQQGSAATPQGYGAAPQRRRRPFATIALVVLLAALSVGAGIFVAARRNAGQADSPAQSSSTDQSESTDVSVTEPIVTDPAETIASDPPTTVQATVPVATIVIPIDSIAPTTTVTTPPTTLPIAAIGFGDLAVPGVQISEPPCDDIYVAVAANAVDPTMYLQAVSAALTLYPGSSYLRTDQSCSSLRPDLNGNPIYMIYFGPFATAQEACAARAFGPEDAYVRQLSNTLTMDHKVDC